MNCFHYSKKLFVHYILVPGRQVPFLVRGGHCKIAYGVGSLESLLGCYACEALCLIFLNGLGCQIASNLMFSLDERVINRDPGTAPSTSHDMGIIEESS